MDPVPIDPTPTPDPSFADPFEGGTLDPHSHNGIDSPQVSYNDLTDLPTLPAVPTTVPNGGTGDTTLAAHGVLIGAGTSPVAVTSAGTSGQLLTSNGASADPTFQTLTPPAGIPAWVDEGSISWASETTDKTLTFTNSSKHVYMLVISLVNGAIIDMQISGDTGADYFYLTASPNSSSINNITSATFFRLNDAASNVMGGILYLFGGARAGVTGSIACNQFTNNVFIGGSWNGALATTSVKFLVHSGTTTGTVHAYSLTP